MKSMKYALNLLLFAGAFPLPAGPGGELIPVARYDNTIPAATSLGEIQLAAREVQLDVVMPNQKTSKGALLVLFDPSSGYFARQFAWVPGYPYPGGVPMMSNFRSYSKAYLAAERLVTFTNTDAVIYIREWRQKAASLDDAESKALQDSTGDLPNYLKAALNGPAFSVDHVLGQNFATEPGNARRGPVRLVEVSRRDGNWEVTLQGRSKAKVILNDKYEVTGNEQIK